MLPWKWLEKTNRKYFQKDHDKNTTSIPTPVLDTWECLLGYLHMLYNCNRFRSTRFFLKKIELMNRNMHHTQMKEEHTKPSHLHVFLCSRGGLALKFFSYTTFEKSVLINWIIHHTQLNGGAHKAITLPSREFLLHMQKCGQRRYRLCHLRSEQQLHPGGHPADNVALRNVTRWRPDLIKYLRTLINFFSFCFKKFWMVSQLLPRFLLITFKIVHKSKIYS